MNIQVGDKFMIKKMILFSLGILLRYTLYLCDRDAIPIRLPIRKTQVKRIDKNTIYLYRDTVIEGKGIGNKVIFIK